MTNENCSALGIEHTRWTELFDSAFDGADVVCASDEDARSKFIIENGITDTERAALREFGKELDAGSLPEHSDKQFSDIMDGLSKFR